MLDQLQDEGPELHNRFQIGLEARFAIRTKASSTTKTVHVLFHLQQCAQSEVAASVHDTCIIHMKVASHLNKSNGEFRETERAVRARPESIAMA